jgi:uncharacterized Rmd1/YagE family protein
MNDNTITVHALQLGERIDLKGLERGDQFSTNPLAYRTARGGTVVLFKSGAAVFVGMTRHEEETHVEVLTSRIKGPLAERETEEARVVVNSDNEELVGALGALQLKAADSNRLLLVAHALAVSVGLAYDERRIGTAFERIGPVAENFKRGRLPSGPRSGLLEQIGEALAIQQRLADRVDLDDKPDVLWEHPELERLWIKLIEEYDLTSRSRAIERKLVVIRETADTITELMATRTSHRLELYIILLIALEIVLGLYENFIK